MKNGFTLVELSIVLVIIGLLIGGILVGQSLIDSARTNRYVSELRSYESIAILFKDRYRAIPGDTTKARTLFGSSVDNGNGDGLIILNSEGFYAWEHLALGGMIDGDYDGLGYSIDDFIPGDNIPKSTADETNGFIYVRTATGATNPYDIGARNIIALSGSNSNDFSTPALTPIQTLSIDTKLDDGSADTGILLGLDAREASGLAWQTDCTTSATPGWSSTAPAEYKINDIKSCYLYYKITGL